MNMRINVIEQDWNYRSEAAKDFLKGALQPNPQFRMTPLQAMSHKWLQNAEELEYDEFCHDILERVLTYQKNNLLISKKDTSPPSDSYSIIPQIMLRNSKPLKKETCVSNLLFEIFCVLISNCKGQKFTLYEELFENLDKHGFGHVELSDIDKYAIPFCLYSYISIGS